MNFASTRVSFAALALAIACTPAQSAVINQIIDFADATCSAVANQPEPAYVVVACVVVDATGKIIQQFEAKIPAADAPAFLAAHKKR